MEDRDPRKKIVSHTILYAVFSASCDIYISRLCYDVSVRLSVRLSVTEMHCGHGACWEEGRGQLALC